MAERCSLHERPLSRRPAAMVEGAFIKVDANPTSTELPVSGRSSSGAASPFRVSSGDRHMSGMYVGPLPSQPLARPIVREAGRSACPAGKGGSGRPCPISPPSYPSCPQPAGVTAPPGGRCRASAILRRYSSSKSSSTTPIPSESTTAVQKTYIPACPWMRSVPSIKPWTDESTDATEMDQPMGPPGM
eukprot:scaffold265645_cov23-Tisochrysis_lutea.AAC.4